MAIGASVRARRESGQLTGHSGVRPPASLMLDSVMVISDTVRPATMKTATSTSMTTFPATTVFPMSMMSLGFPRTLGPACFQLPPSLRTHMDKSRISHQALS
ncbi:hypothetical protein ACIBCT_13400 [Streptosporangium sp. NPDC050855]|uniref:hypothetical protein n=1 Tax=Streptosporangium sp. NPDC050855 TaxID=3366194 RepID=UPI00378F229C